MCVLVVDSVPRRLPRVPDPEARVGSGEWRRRRQATRGRKAGLPAGVSTGKCTRAPSRIEGKSGKNKGGWRLRSLGRMDHGPSVNPKVIGELGTGKL